MSGAPSLVEVLDTAVPFEVPLRVPFRGVTHRAGLLLQGPAGWGEFAPFDDYAPRMAARWLAAALEAAWTGWPVPVRDSVAVNLIVPAVPPAQVAALLPQDSEAVRWGAHAWASESSRGATARPSGALLPQDSEASRSAAHAGASESSRGPTVKVKITGDLGTDRERVAAVRDIAGPHARIRLDVNAGWTLEQALRQLPELERAAGGLEYVEQPLASLADIAELRRATGIRVAVDESLRLATDPFDPAMLALVRASADVAVLKVAPLGGVANVLTLAERLGMPVVVSSAMDTAVGLSAGIAAACALPQPPLACGLGTGLLLAGDVIEPPLTPIGGRLSPVHVTPRTDLGDTVAKPEAARLMRRLAQAWEYL